MLAGYTSTCMSRFSCWYPLFCAIEEKPNGTTTLLFFGGGSPEEKQTQKRKGNQQKTRATHIHPTRHPARSARSAVRVLHAEALRRLVAPLQHLREARGAEGAAVQPLGELQANGPSGWAGLGGVGLGELGLGGWGGGGWDGGG